MPRHSSPVRHNLKTGVHPYLSGPWTPNFEEYTATDLEVIGRIPTDIEGVYIRNTENPVMEPLGHYHPFDGDGMLHAVWFADGRATYRNRFVRTAGFLAEQEAGKALWAGIANHSQKSLRPGTGAHGGLKDASSTDVVVHGGQVLSTFWQCGQGYQLDVRTLDAAGTVDWAPPAGISAHPKVDPFTGELLFFNYTKEAPYQHYGVVDRHNRLIHYTAIPLPGPRLPHDMAFTGRHSILADLPLYWDPDLLARGRHHARYFPEQPSRFAILPRYGTEKDVRWFEAEPTYVLHWGNAYEEGDEIVLDGFFQENPDPAPLPGVPGAAGKMMANLDIHSFRPRLHRWRFNLVTGAVREESLCDEYTEFGTFNPQYTGKKYRYLYSARGAPGMFLFTGLVRHDLQTGATNRLSFGEQCYGSEAPFVPRKGATAEDDGYLVSFVTDMIRDRSECILVDARDLEGGPVCRIILPHRICSGTHACWAAL